MDGRPSGTNLVGWSSWWTDVFWTCNLSCAFLGTSGKKLPVKATMIINIITTNLDCSVERVSVGQCQNYFCRYCTWKIESVGEECNQLCEMIDSCTGVFRETSRFGETSKISERERAPFESRAPGVPCMCVCFIPRGHWKLLAIRVVSLTEHTGFPWSWGHSYYRWRDDDDDDVITMMITLITTAMTKMT